MPLLPPLPRLLLLLSALVAAASAQADGSALLSADHFEELVLPQDGGRRVARNTVLCLYGDNCNCDIKKEFLPPLKYMYYLTYSRDIYPRYMWYQPGEKGTLHERYHLSDACLEVLFFRVGDDVMAPRARWNQTEDPNIYDWIMDVNTFMVSVSNGFKDALMVTQQTMAGAVFSDKQMVNSQDTTSISCYPGNILYFETASDNDVVYADVCDRYKMMALGPHVKMISVQRLRASELEEIKKSRAFMYTTGQRHLISLRQPTLVKNYTPVGYKQFQMPREMYLPIRNYYYNNYKSISTEPIVAKYEVINMNYKLPGLVNMNDELVRKIVPMLQPLLEEWCNCSLEFTMAFGIREYYNGHILYNHVDIVETHVISAILQIDQETTTDWPLEVVGYDGKRDHISFAAGDMLFYESAKLIHGRPTRFQGERYANAYFHFAPKEWNYVVDGFHNTEYDNYGILNLKDFSANVETPLWPVDVQTRPMSNYYFRDEL